MTEDEGTGRVARSVPTTGFVVRGGVTSVYQPIVDLDSGQVVAFEALARGHGHLAGLSPGDLFATARRTGVEERLDWECRAAAFRGALAARLPAGLPLFVNVEPRWLTAPCPEDLRPTVESASSRLRMVIEITERDLVGDPAALLAAVGTIRRAGWGVALDDVGAEPESLALMPFIEPDVIKLDLSLIQNRTSQEIAAIVNAVGAQAERTGALVLAEGIETEEHRRRALALGATLGQGWLLGRPGPLPRRLPVPTGGSWRFDRPDELLPVTPFEVVADRADLRETTKDLLLPMSLFLERHARTTQDRPVLLAAFQDVAHLTPSTVRRYRELATHCSFVAVLAAGMRACPIDDARSAVLAPDDPLRGEWVVATVGPHFAGALIAKDLHADDHSPLPDRDRRFRFTIIHDRDQVLRAARGMLRRIGAADTAR